MDVTERIEFAVFVALATTVGGVVGGGFIYAVAYLVSTL